MIGCIVNSHLNLPHNTIDANNNQWINWNPEVDISWDDIMERVCDYCEPEWIGAEEPLFILYTRFCKIINKINF